MAILSRDESDSYQRWELPSVGAQPVRRKEEPVVARPTVAEIESIELAAREEGFNAGLAEGRATARRELTAQVARVEALLASAARPLAALDADVGRELAWLATVIAERVLMGELSTSPEKILDVVNQAVNVLPAGERHIRVFLHPDDAAIVRDHRTAGEIEWSVVDDRAMHRGDCRLESEHSRLDASLRTRLAAVIDAVLGEEAILLGQEP